jgi:glyoxylase-like metal-dependent hydrolase (beta-lactamase superfamily II)
MSNLWHFQNETVRIRKISVGAYENNAYIVACRATGEAIIVDAAAEADRIFAAVTDVKPRSIITTHGHFDHVGAAKEVAATLGIPFRLHVDDVALAGMKPDEGLDEGPIQVGEATISAIHTPGHTRGSMSLITEGAALTGDTLFPGGPGATRGPGSNFETIIASITDRLLTLPADTIVMPGHGLDTTIATETPSLGEWIERGW